MNSNYIEIPPHAGQRMCQRAIPPGIVLLLLEFGKTEYSHGDIILHLHNKGAWQKAARQLSADGHVVDNRWRNIYIVVTGDMQTVITVGWRYKRIKKNQRQRRGKGSRRRM